MKRQAKQVLWLSDSRGIYLPRDFALSFKDRDSCVTGVSAEDWADLEKGPEGGLLSEGGGSRTYWDTWQDVCDNAEVTMDGVVYTLWQDGDCWLLEQGAESDDTGEISETGWFIEYDDPNYLELTAPSAWASYLINDDASGLEDDERIACDAWVKSVDAIGPEGCEAAGFRRSHDAWEFYPLAGDCQIYAFRKKAAPAYWSDGTDTGIAMRATDKGRSDSLITMVQGDRRDALEFDRLVGTPDAKRVEASLAKADAELDE